MFKEAVRHKFVVVLSFVSFLLSLGGFLWAIVVLRGASRVTPLILHFNDVQGITQTGGMDLLIFMGIVGAIITATNGLLALAFDERDAAIGKFIAILNLVFSILLFIAFASIISVN